MLHYFANPTRFQRLSRRVEPWLLTAMLVCFGAGLYFALFSSPVDYQQGHTVRIMYIHVPAAWMALFCYTAMAVAAAVAEVRARRRAVQLVEAALAAGADALVPAARALRQRAVTARRGRSIRRARSCSRRTTAFCA